MWRGLRVGVVIPAFNEERLIGKTLRAVPTYVDRIVVVNDASKDRTREAVETLRDARVQLLNHLTNQGVGAAIVSGYRQTLAEHLDVTVVIAADNQMSPEDMPSLLNAVAAGADYVKGNRFVHPRYRQMPMHRRLGGRWLAGLTSWASGLQIHDSQCGYTAISRTCLAQLPLEDLWPRFGYPNDLLLMLGAYGQRVAEVPVEPVYADEESGIHLGHAFSIGWRIISRRKRFAKPRSLKPSPNLETLVG